MTRTVNQFPGQRTYTGRRPGTVYVYNTLRCDENGTPTAGTEVGYVGQTVQPLASRDRQHRGMAPGPDGSPPQCQPWADIIVGSVTVLEQGLWTCDELTGRETFHIRRLAPRYNYSENLGNPTRIPIFEARRQQQNRDLARGAVVTTWPDRGCRPTVTRKRAAKLSRKAKRRLSWTAALSVAFLFAWLALILFAAPRYPSAWWLWPIRAAEPFAVPLIFKPRRRDNRKAVAGVLAAATLISWLATG